MDDEELTTIEYAICPCIAAVSRTWAAFRPEEPDSWPELSRAVKGLLDTIAVHVAAATVPYNDGKKKRWNEDSSSVQTRECSAIRPRVRQMLIQGLIFPLLDVVDPWALQQSRIGLKPAAACEVLRTFVSSYRERYGLVSGERINSTEGEPAIEGVPTFVKQGVPISAPAAVSGLSGGRLKAKVAAKRQQRVRHQKRL